jgi:prolyl-tRNA synthetase
VEEDLQPLSEASTPGTKSIVAVSSFLGTPSAKTIKTLAYRTEKGLLLALVRGDHEVNEIKLQNLLNCLQLELADEASVNNLTGSNPGFIGPVGLKNVTIIADASVMNMRNAVCGANKADYHYINVTPGRDFTVTQTADIRLIQENDPCPRCGVAVKTARGIEVGQVFKLFTKYSNSLKATYLDENGKEQLMVMGCYGIGVSRTMAAAIEQHHDDNGIIWPAAIAPYQAVIIPINVKDEAQLSLAEKVYAQLNQAGIEAVLDDREERAGVKFKDADLIGYPLKITLGPKAVSENQIEVKVRRNNEVTYFAADNYIDGIKALLTDL